MRVRRGDAEVARAVTGGVRADGRAGGLHERQVWRARCGVGGGEELNI